MPALSLTASILYCVYVATALPTEPKVAACFTVAATAILMADTFLMVFRSASDTIRYCYLKDSKFNHESEMNLYEVHVDETLDKDLP